MPTVIPYQDSTNELFNAYRTLEDVKQSAQKIAMDQALANQHIQSAQIVDQMNRARAQMEQQQATEYSSPEAVTQRGNMRGIAQNQAMAGLDRSEMMNEQMRKTNPLDLRAAQQSIEQANIHIQNARTESKFLESKLKNEQDRGKLAYDAMRYDFMSNGGMDPHTAALRAQAANTQAKQALTLLPLHMQAQIDALDAEKQRVADQHMLSVIHGLGTVAQSASTPFGPELAQGIFKGTPGTGGLQDVNPDLMKQGNDQKQIFLRQLGAYKESNDPQVKQAIIDNAAYDFLPRSYKGPSELDQMQAIKSGKPVTDRAMDNARKVAEEIFNKSTYDAATKKLKMPGGDFFQDQPPQSGLPTGNPKGAMDISTQAGTLPTQQMGGGVERGQYALRGGQPTTMPAPTGSTQPSGTMAPGVTAGTQDLKIDTKPIESSLDRIEKIISKIPEEGRKRLYLTNRASPSVYRTENSSGDTSTEDAAVMNASDPKYTIGSNGSVFDRKKYNEFSSAEYQRRTGAEVGDREDAMALAGTLKDEEFKRRIKEQITSGLNDKAATTAQTTRFSAVMSQMAKAYNEQGQVGLTTVWNIARQKYKANSENGISLEQGRALAALISSYGVQ